MNNLPKEKRNQLVLVGLGTVALIAGLWFGLIRAQQENLRTLASRKETAQRKLDDVQRTIKQADALDVQLTTASNELSKLEEKMASGDLYEWMLRTIGEFKLPYRVDIPAFSTHDVGDTSILPKFPYKQITISITGTACFHDIGKFITDFENEFPRIRIQSLELENPSGQADSEKLTFKMSFVALIKSTST